MSNFKKIRKGLSLLLTILMIFSAIPLHVFANDEVGSNDNGSTGSELITSGSGSITGAGTGPRPNQLLADLSGEEVTAIEFNANRFISPQTQNQRFVSYFATLSNGGVIAFRARALGAAGHTGFDQLNFGIGGTFDNATGGGGADSLAFSANMFSAYNAAFTSAATAETANDYTIVIVIDGTEVTGALTINGTPISSLDFAEPVPVGTTIAGVYAFSHSNTITIQHIWSLYNLNPDGSGGGSEPEPTIPVEIPQLTAGTGIDGSATLRWEAVEFADRYYVYYREYPNGTFSTPIALGNVLTHTIPGLMNDQYYEFALRAANDLGLAADEHKAVVRAFVHVADVELEADSWFESIGATWTARPVDTGFNLYVSPTGANDWTWINDSAAPVVGQSNWTNDHSALVREVAPHEWRGDILGLRGGMAYDIRLVAHHDGLTLYANNLTPAAFDRQGFAFDPTSPFGEATGAYNPDGTLRDDAVVIYVTAENVNTFTTPWQTTGIGGTNGLFHENNVRNRAGANAGAMIDATPVAIRFVGNIPRPATVRTGNMIRVARSANFTFEGVGADAVINGWGLNIMSSNVVVRNLTFDGYTDDAINLEGWGGTSGQWPTAGTGLLAPSANTGNRISTNIWVTQNTFKDTAGGDGAIDASNNSSYFTLSWNRVYDGGRLANLGSTQNNIRFRASLHSNYISNNESRVPRVRWGQVHFYNNVINGANVYAIGAGHHSNVIAEGNYFVRANRPMIISNQGASLIGGNNTLTGDYPGYLITTLTTPANHLGNPRGTAEIFALANELEGNIFGEITTFDPSIDQGLPAVTNSRNAQPFQFFNPHTLNMNVNVTTAEVARINVPLYAGVVQGAVSGPGEPIPPSLSLHEDVIGNPASGEWTLHENGEINFSGVVPGGNPLGGSAVNHFHMLYVPLTAEQIADYESIFVETVFSSQGAATANDRSSAGVMVRATNATANPADGPWFGELFTRRAGGNSQIVFGGPNAAGNSRGVAQLPWQGTDWQNGDEFTFRLSYIPGDNVPASVRYMTYVNHHGTALPLDPGTVRGNAPSAVADFSEIQVGLMAVGLEATFADFRIIGVCADGTENVIFDIHTAGTAGLARPENFEATTGISGEVALSWDRVPGAATYEVAYRLATDTSSILEWLNVGNVLGHTFSDLTNDVEYVFYVRGVDSQGYGQFASIYATPIDDAEAIELTTGAWFETVYASFTAPADAELVAHVRVAGGLWEAVDTELIRVVDESRNTWRVDVPGRRAVDGENHELRIRQLEEGAIIAEGLAAGLAPIPFDRQGAAFVNGITTGGYNADGTVPANAIIIYVTPENAHSVLTTAAFPSGGGSNVNRPNTPTIIRIMGQIGEVGFVGDTSGLPPGVRDNFFLNIRGRENVTIEGIGPDAMLYGFGIQVHNSHNVEIRNLSFDMFFEDGVGIHGNNSGTTSTHYWIHHNRFFYGQNRYVYLGHDDDLQFGDGGLDITNHARNFTVSHNQFFGTDKSMLLGNAMTDTIAYGTVHHNWFEGSSQRLPRVRNAQVHVFNNLYIGATHYGIGAGHLSSIVSEGNTFRNTNRPYIISGQGSAGLGTLSTDSPGAIMVASNDTGIFGRSLLVDYLDEFSARTFQSNDVGLNNINPRGSHNFIAAGFPYAPSALGVQTATDAEVRVRAYAGPIDRLTPTVAPAAPRITSLVINPEVRAGIAEEHVTVEEGRFTIQWTGDLITQTYEIEWDQGNGNWEQIATVNRSGRPLRFITTDQFATPGGTYSFRVVARNAAGETISEIVSVTYARPNAPTNLVATNILGGLNIEFDAPIPPGASYEIRMYMIETVQGELVVGAAPLVFIAPSSPYQVLDVAPGIYRIEVRAQVGRHFSEPLVGTGEVLPWRIQIADLTTPVWAEDFTTWAHGPVRGADAEALGLRILNATNGPLHTNVVNTPFIPANVVEGRNDVFINEDGLRLLDVSAPEVDRHPNGTGLVRPEGTMMAIDIGEEITDGRVLVDIELNYVRSADGNSMRPLRLWDGGGRPIIDFRVDQLPTVPTGPSGQNATAAQIEAGIVTPLSETQHWQIAIDFETRRFDMFLNGAAFLFDQPLPADVTGLQWIGAVTPTGNQSGHNWAELSVNYRSISVLTEGAIAYPGIVRGGFNFERTENFPETLVVDEGDDVTLTIAAIPTVPYSIMTADWLRDNISTTNGIFSVNRRIGGGYYVTLTIQNISLEDQGIYQLGAQLLNENGFVIFEDISPISLSLIVNVEICLVIAEGQFANQSGVDGIAGSEWRLCEDGILEIDEGFINWSLYQGPWATYVDEITGVVIAGSITAGTSLRSLFRDFQVTEIEGLTYFDTSRTRNMENMFRGASALARLDLSSFDTANVTNMQRMFTNMRALRELTLGAEFSFIANAGLPTLSQGDEYTGLWENGEFVFTSAQLMNQFDRATMTGTFVWQVREADICEVVSRGRFANQTGAGGIAGASWSLCDDGTLGIGAGFINWTIYNGPWHNYRNDITAIVITGPITAGTSLRSLFRDLNYVSEIEGLSYFDTSRTTSMENMFRTSTGIVRLDLSSFDSSNVTNMHRMFTNMHALEYVNFGENFTPADNSGLPAHLRP